MARHIRIITTVALAIIALWAVACGEDDEQGTPTPTDTVEETAPPTCTTPTPAGAPCNPICEEGCAEGETCTFDGSNSTFECIVPGDIPLGDPCNGAHPCVEGACVGYAGAEQVCRPFCVDQEDCPEGMPCNIQLVQGSEIMVCADAVESCDLFAQDCGGIQGCYPTSAGPGCEPAGLKEAGDACSGSPECQAGLMCAGSAGGSICSTICDSSGTNADFACETFCPNGYASIGDLDGVGICIVAEVACDLLWQDCEDGEGCYPGSGGAWCATAGTSVEGDPCDTTSSCEPGLACAGSGSEGVCTPMCDPTGDTIPEKLCDTICADTHSTLVEGVDVCAESGTVDACSLLTQNCPEGEGCYALSEGPTCTQAGTMGEGEACGYANDCAAGYICIGSGSDMACTKLCDPTDTIAGVGCTELCPDGTATINGLDGVAICDSSGAGDTCDLLAQDCADGMGCYSLTGGPQCTQAGTAGEGESCEYANSCLPGYICAGTGGQMTCLELCDPTGATAPAKACDTVCPDSHNGITGLDGVEVCTEPTPVVPCDLVAQDCAAAGEACYYTSSGAVCAPAGDVAAGGACSSANECAAGLICGNDTCLVICDTTNDTCAEGTCQSIGEDMGNAGACN